MDIIKGRVLLSDRNLTVIYKKGYLYKIQKGNDTAKVSLHLGKNVFFAKFRILQRLFRLAPRIAVVKSEDELIISGNNEFIILDFPTWTIKKRIAYRDGMHTPLNIEKTMVNENRNEMYVFGEYFSNSGREPVRVVGYRNGLLETVYTFPEGTIRHIHRCIDDTKKNRLLILTGDEDKESGIWELPKGKVTAVPVLVGKQQYRACMAWCSDNEIFYATDTPLEQNYLYKYDEKSGKLDRIMEIAGPCIYGADLTMDGERIVVLATSVEPDSRLGTINYQLTRKRSKCIWDNSCHIYVGNNKRGFKELLALRKDFLPMGLFQMGNCEFIADDRGERLFLIPTGVKRFDGLSLIYSYSEIKKALQWQ